MSIHSQANAPAGSSADELTPLEVSQAVLESEENPNTARPLTARERAASGWQPGDGERSRFARALRSPAAAWGGAALAGLGLVAALVYARRTPPSRWQALKALPARSLPRRRGPLASKPLSFRV
ncbi:hypothetical protein M2165_000272 [Variovorax sp. TBS-050B]|uniref:hypothetical protein n=1 Tax=Variovorax sp. TBS-050B TaxID=2940551 RepID=UPI0024744468|nr:hypothetical protein [Variovorax sp. TBS-050B]MDH6590383.1 hypothetical protein [Variovorax sp. TBS-050B]